MLKILRHRVMLHGHEESIQHNTNGDSQVYKRVHHDQVHNLLNLHPYRAALPDKKRVGKFVPAWWTIPLRLFQFWKRRMRSMVTMVTDFLFFFLNSTFLRLQHMDIPSTNVLVSALMTLLARSLRPNDVLSCSTETIRDPESFFLISRSVVGCQEKNNEVKQ